MSHSSTALITAALVAAMAFLAGEVKAAATHQTGECADMMHSMHSMHRGHMQSHGMAMAQAKHHVLHHRMMVQHCNQQGAAAMTPAKHMAIMRRMHPGQHGIKQHGKDISMHMPMKMTAAMPAQTTLGSCGTYMYRKARQCLDARTKK